MIIGLDQETAIRNYRKWNRRRGRNYQTLNEDDKVIYCYCPLNPRKTGSGSNVDACPQILVEYDGVIIQKTPYHVTLEIVPRDGQINGTSTYCYGNIDLLLRKHRLIVTPQNPLPRVFMRVCGFWGVTISRCFRNNKSMFP